MKTDDENIGYYENNFWSHKYNSMQNSSDKTICWLMYNSHRLQKIRFSAPHFVYAYYSFTS